jgi:two-component system sensor histidine kinase/response regulator
MSDTQTDIQTITENGKLPSSGLQRFLDSGHEFSEAEQGLRYKHRYVNTVVATCSVIVSCFGIWRLLTGHNQAIAIADLLFGCIILGLLVVLRKNPKSVVEPVGTAVLALSFLMFSLFYVIIPDSVRSGPFLLITASAFFLKGIRHGIAWMLLCMAMMLAIEIIPSPYAKGWYGTLTSMLDIFCLMLLLALYEHQKNQDADRLRSNEARFHTIFDSSNDAILLLEGEHFSQWNSRAPELLNCPAESLAGRSLIDLLADEAPPEHRAALHTAETAVLCGKTTPIEVLLRRQSGPDFYANIRLTQINIDNKQLIQAIIRDIDARKRSELELVRYRDELEQRVQERTHRLEESELRFARLLELTEEGIFIHENGILVDVTNAFCRLTGYRRNELIGQNFLTFLVDPDMHQYIISYMTAKNSHKYELRARRQNGSYVEVEAFGRSFENEGRMLRAGVWRDVTARKETERTLRTAQTLAEEANRAKSAFIANMSHEIRTPLNAIIGITHQLQRDSEDSREKSRLDRVAGAAKHLLQVLTDILDISKIEAGKLTLEQRPFLLSRLIDGVANILQDSAEQKGLSFRLLIDDRMPTVLTGDSFRLSQILINLLSNSVKFTESGNVTLSISVTDINESQATICFRVSDTGIGMSGEQQSRLFKDFEQAESTTTRKYGGTGLGLSISRRLVELMGSRIQVRSEIGSGSEFWFMIIFPYGAPLDFDQTEIIPQGTSAQVRAQHAGAKILLVEDAVINQEVAIDLLDEAGLNTDIAENGKQAVDLVAKDAYDLVLMDLQMPIMDGFQATREIRALPGGKTLPIVAMTANAYAEDKENCLQAGMNDYIAKPIEPAVLFAILQRWLPKVTNKSDSTPEAPGLRSVTDDDAQLREALGRLAEQPGFGGLDKISIAQRKPARYVALLRQFFDHHGDDGHRLQAFIEANTDSALAEAKRLAHTLKGIAATFGLLELLAIAEKAQQLLMMQDGSVMDSEIPTSIDKGAIVATAACIQASLQQLQTSAHEILWTIKKP